VSWVFENLQLILVIGGTIAWWLTQRNQDQDETPPPTDRPGRQKIDVDQLERNRRLRDEIRRKREERRSGAPPPVTPTGQPERESPGYGRSDVPPEMAEQMPPVLRELMGIPEPEPPPPPAPPPIPDTNPVLERQQRMQEEMAALEAKRREAEARAARVSPGVSRPRRRRPAGGTATSLDKADFLATLRDPLQARRAIVLREILGKPVAMQNARPGIGNLQRKS